MLIRNNNSDDDPVGFYIDSYVHTPTITIYRNFEFTLDMKLLTLYSSIILLLNKKTNKTHKITMDFRPEEETDNFHFLLPCGAVSFMWWDPYPMSH